MTKPKKWHMKEDKGSITLWYQDGPIKRPNATEALGTVLKVSKPSLAEYSGKHEAILVSSG